MRNPENVLNSLQEHSAQSGYVYDRLYRNLFNREFFLQAYQNIYASQGNMTAGTDGKTIDAMSLERVDRLIAALKDESYQPKPSRRTYIPKKNGKLRPLGIPSIDDKLVQEVVRMLLESIYENSFEDTSHGFRPNKSCHTALRMIQNRFTRCKWFVEGDIKGFFDNIDHNVMIGILRKRIKDERFLRLIRKFLNAGYMEDNQVHQSYSGTPQGGIISPILANIYLDQFDKYMAEFKKRFDRGNKRAVNVEYRKLSDKRIRLKRKLAKAKTEEEKQSLVRDKPFLIGLPKVVLRTDPDALKDLFQFLRRGGKLHPFTHKGALVVLAQVGDEGGKGIIFVIVIMGHSDTSLQFRRRLFPMGLRLALVGTFLPALFQPLLDGGLFLRLLLPGALMLPLVAGEGEIASARKTALFLLYGVIAEGNRINGVQQLRGQKDVQMLRQIAPAHILHLADVGLQNEILGIRGKLPELLQGGQSEGRLLDSGQEVTVLRGKSGKRLGRCLQFACVTTCGEQRLQMLHEVDLGFTFCHAHHPFVWETPT